MNLEHALRLLKENNIIVESPDFNMMDQERIGNHAAKTASSNKIAGRDVVQYEDDKRYNDYQGIKWLDVKKRDEDTLLSAIIDGISDAQLTHYDESIDSITDDGTGDKASQILYYEKEKKRLENAYKNISNKEELLGYLEDEFDIDSNLVDNIIRFLNKYKRRTTTVYRGFNFTNKEYELLVKGKDIRKQSSILELLSNKTKRFNSFSVSPIVASEFAGKTIPGKYYSFVIAGEVEPNDINFAFTAYLMGRHGTIGEYELNINNLKDIKNLRLLTDPAVEINRMKKYMLSSDKIQRMLDDGKDLNDIFDSVVPLDDDIGTLWKKNGHEGYYVLYKGYVAYLKDRKLMSPFFRGHVEPLGNIENEVIKIYTKEDGYNTRICKLGKGYVTDINFNSIIALSTSNYAVLRTGDGKYYLLDLCTGRMVFKNAMSYISYIGVNWPKDWYIIVTQKGENTIITDKKEIAFIGPMKTFSDIKFVRNELAVEVTYKNKSNKEIKKKYALKNNKLMEVYG